MRGHVASRGARRIALMLGAEQRDSRGGAGWISAGPLAGADGGLWVLAALSFVIVFPLVSGVLLLVR
jgi:hypothetical protein